MEKFEKYLTRKNAAMPEEHLAILEKDKKMPAASALQRKDINKLFEPGYLAGENGYCRMDNGSMYTAVLTKMPNVTLDMRNKLKIILLLITGISTNAFCCLMASQERIIPIGTSENCLIGMEILSIRYGEGEFGEKELWNYKITLKGFNEDYSEFFVNNLDSVNGIKNSDFEKLLKLQIDKALQICNKLENFEILKPKEISFCDYQKDCSKLKLKEINGQLKFQVNKTNKSFPIHYLDTVFQGEIARHYKAYFEFYFEDSIIGTDLKISSIREYENNYYKLLIFHLGTGQQFELAATGKLPQKKEIKFTKELNTIKDAIFTEPILHHGKGFDYFKLNKK